MSTLPNGWRIATLGDICHPSQYGWTTRASGQNGTLRFLRTTDISSGPIEWDSVPFAEQLPEEPERYLLHSGDIVISRAGSIGLSALIGECPPSLFASYLIRFRPYEELSPKFVALYLQSSAYWTQVRASAVGIALQNVNATKLARIKVPIAPRLEQDRIVAEIEKQFTRLDDAVTALRRVQANLKRYRASVLKAACEGRLVPTEAELARKERRAYEPASEFLKRILAERRAKWEADQLQKMIAAGKPPKNDQWKKNYREPRLPDTTDVMNLPKGWTCASLDQLFAVERGRFSVRPRNDPRYFNGPYPFVQIGSLPREGGLITAYEQTLNVQGLQVSKMFRKGTALIAIVGATIANTGILAFDSCCPDSLVGLQQEDTVLVRFAEAFLRSRKLLLRQASYASGGQPNINLAMLLPYQVPLPPTAEQERIVAELEKRLTTLENMESLLQKRLITVDSLQQSVLRKGFEGEFVPQDPNDEPASVLLERIRAERASAASNGKDLLAKRGKLQPEQTCGTAALGCGKARQERAGFEIASNKSCKPSDARSDKRRRRAKRLAQPARAGKQ